MARNFHHLLPPNPPKQPGDKYVVWTAGPYRSDIEQVLAELLEEAQSETAAFRPDDLAEEILIARKHLAVRPNHPPTLTIYSDETIVYTDDGTPLFQPTHVLPGRIVNIWYVLWEKETYVGICRLEPNIGRANSF